MKRLSIFLLILVAITLFSCSGSWQNDPRSVYRCENRGGTIEYGICVCRGPRIMIKGYCLECPSDTKYTYQGGTIYLKDNNLFQEGSCLEYCYKQIAGGKWIHNVPYAGSSCSCRSKTNNHLFKRYADSGTRDSCYPPDIK